MADDKNTQKMGARIEIGMAIGVTLGASIGSTGIGTTKSQGSGKK
jgi:hypothetical protein